MQLVEQHIIMDNRFKDWCIKAKNLYNQSYVGRRTKRGLFRTANRIKINADANGAANILRKVIGNEWIHPDSILSALIAPVKKLTFTQKVA